MSSSATKTEQALEACGKVINGIEDETISVSSSLLLCMKIARLVNDLEGQEWLSYEYGGYPKEGEASSQVWEIADKHGRVFRDKDENGKSATYMFTSLCGELEVRIDSDKKALNNYSTQGFSVAGEWALAATTRLTSSVEIQTQSLLKNITTAQKNLSILKSQYYEYALRWQLELQFGSTAKTIFDEYQEKVNEYYSSLPKPTLQKLSAIEELMEDGNPERYAQVLTSCRRLWADVANALFTEVLPNYSGKMFKTKSGQDIDVSGDHDNNKLSAVIETLQAKAMKNTLVGSETRYLIDWLEQINHRQSEGVHAEVTREQAMRCIIHTYIALGDILSLKIDAMDNKKLQ